MLSNRSFPLVCLCVRYVCATCPATAQRPQFLPHQSEIRLSSGATQAFAFPGELELTVGNDFLIELTERKNLAGRAGGVWVVIHWLTGDLMLGVERRGGLIFHHSSCSS